MRREIYRMPRAQALKLLQRAPFVHLATTDDRGAPILRSVHGVLVDEFLCFHGAPAGEKMAGLGRRCVISAEEIVAEIPSYFIDPERACPATTYYESVQLHGVLEAVDDAEWKARALAALMQRFQPEGGHVPITADHPLYRKPVEGLLVARVGLAELDGKSKLGQNRQPDELQRVLEGLWRRGQPGDAAAIMRVLARNPAVPLPRFLVGPPGVGVRLSCAPRPETAAAAARLLVGTYWNGEFDAATLTACQTGSTAWVTAHALPEGAAGPDEEGPLVGSARAISDGAKRAWIYDVIVAPSWQRRGVGDALMRLLLDHPAVRHVRKVHLSTRDAQRLYERHGFVTVGKSPTGHSEMALTRPASASEPLSHAAQTPG